MQDVQITYRAQHCPWSMELGSSKIMVYHIKVREEGCSAMYYVS